MGVQIAIRPLSSRLEELEGARKLSAWDGIFIEVWQSQLMVLRNQERGCTYEEPVSGVGGLL